MTQTVKIHDIDVLLELKSVEDLPLCVIKRMAGSVVVLDDEDKCIYVDENETTYLIDEDSYSVIKKKYQTLSEILVDFTPIAIAIGLSYSIEYDTNIWKIVEDSKIVLGKVSFTKDDAEAIVNNLNGEI